MPALILTVVVLSGFFYFLSTYLHPFRPCGTCKGTGVHRGAVFRTASRNCASCGGKGRYRRSGAPSVGKAFGEARKR
jgi:DnaJ-class molecular chaperone